MTTLKSLGFFETISTQEATSISLCNLKVGVNDQGNYIIKLNKDRSIDYVIDKICDHAGGRLIVKGDFAVCPMHDWRLNLMNLHYNNDSCKKSLPFQFLDSQTIQIPGTKHSLSNPFKYSKKGEVKFRWLNHATLYLECNGLSLITDPWLFGPAFLTGWWLDKPSPKDSIDLLKNADYIFISHNHPDHLHSETLAIVPKDKKIIVPNYQSKSCEKYVRSLGFTNIYALEFKEILELSSEFQFSILKSGDFRDDSGAYICANGFEFVLTVDANFLNSYILPKKVDFLMSSFAGGASGFPLCYSDYSLLEIQQVLNRNRNAVKFAIQKNLEALEPSYYLPYAGMFKEKSKRDAYIFTNNAKNSFESIKAIVEAKNCLFVEPKSNTEYVYTTKNNNNQLVLNDINVNYLEEENTEFYINNLKEEYPFDAQKIISYFKQSGFNEKNIIQIIPVNDTFEEITGQIVFVDFHNHVFKVIDESELIDEKDSYKVMKLKIRSEILMCTIENKLPWEDISIGFQMRATRIPNEYESNFWYYFTNVYIVEKNFRNSSYCGACTIIDQNPIWIKKK